ncbi:MAG: SDR family NAD(P)-dependent oxidoreductase [Pseudomonadales bacterium]|nr:SDR family NAD(P)-dependent oxidoreductase [Pseudomonadales bacterium]
MVIFGATSAVAADMAKEYANQGHNLYLVARNKERLVSLEKAIGNNVVGSFCYDFNDTEVAKRAVIAAKEALGNIDIAVLAHGDLGDQLRSETDFLEAEQTIKTNLLSAVAIIIPLAELLKKQGAGKLAVLLSVAGDRGRPRNFTYATAKGGLGIYLQGLRSALYSTGVKVYCFKLGPVDSPMTVDHEKNFSFSSVEKVSALVRSGIEENRYTRYVPGYWFWVMWAVRWMPEWLFQKLGFLSDR